MVKATKNGINTSVFNEHKKQDISGDTILIN